MADKNVGKITQIISAVLDIKFTEGNLPEINDAIDIPLKNGGKLVVEVAQHLGDDTVSPPGIWSALRSDGHGNPRLSHNAGRSLCCPTGHIRNSDRPPQ